MKRTHAFLEDTNGAAAIEFALAGPVLILMLIGILQIGILFHANAGLQNAVGEGARYATIYPAPNETQIKARINDRRFGMDAARLTGPTLSFGTDSGTHYVDIAMSYSVPLNFVFFEGPAVTLREKQRAYMP